VVGPDLMAALENRKPILVIGYGNMLCGDDGLGQKVIELLIPRLSPELSQVTDVLVLHQLDVILCARLNNYRHIIFVDAQTDLYQKDVVTIDLANKEEAENLAKQPGFSAHFLTPEDLLEMTRKLYSECPLGLLMAVRGFQTEPGTGLSAEALKNANKAVETIIQHLENITRV
jgi:hydrogenase maturation protease